MEKKYTLLFDFDGTLVDSMPCFSFTMIKVIKEFGLPYPENIIEILTPLGYGGSAKYMIEKLGAKENEDALVSKMHEYAYNGYAREIVLKDGVFDFLNGARSLGYSLNVLTASPHRMLDVCIKRNCVFDLFDNVWSCEDFGTTKSDPNIYISAAERLGTDISRVAFFDDNLHAIETAKLSGAYTIGVFDVSGAAFTEQLKTVAHRYLPTFDESTEAIIKNLKI